MRLWICFAVIASTLMSSNIVAGAADPNYFALLEDCRLVRGENIDELKANVSQIKASDYKGSNCKYSQLLHAMDEVAGVSYVMIFTPGDIGDISGKPTKNMQVYGRTIKTLDAPIIDFSKDIEVIDFSYALPETCTFVPDKFKVGLDVNVIHMMVKCGDEHFSLLRSQVNYQKFTVFTPKTWLAHFDKDPLGKIKLTVPCPVNKHVFVPRRSNEQQFVQDSYVLRYCDDMTSGKLVSYATPLHNIMEKVDEEFVLEANQRFDIDKKKIQDMNFYGSSAFTMKFSDYEFFMGTIKNERVEDPVKFMNLIQQADKLNFDRHAKVVATGQEIVTSNPGGNETVWKFRTQQDPELQQGLKSIAVCDFEDNKEKYKACVDDYDWYKMINIVLFCLIGFEILLIVATIAIFAFCIFAQRRRRHRHREQKAARRGGKHGKHGKHGKKKHKKDGDDPETDGTNNTNKSTEKTPKTSKKENDKTKTEE